MVPVNTINKTPTFWAARFLNTELCTREGVYPFAFFVASDRKNDEGGAKVPQPIWDDLIGYSDPVVVDAEGKHKDGASVCINPIGCFDQGNAAPTKYVDAFKENKLTANQVLMLTVGGDREGLGNNAERRIVCSTPSMIITDPTSRRCMIQKSSRLFKTVRELFGTEGLWVLLFSFAALKIIMASDMGARAHSSLPFARPSRRVSPSHISPPSRRVSPSHKPLTASLPQITPTRTSTSNSPSSGS